VSGAVSSADLRMAAADGLSSALVRRLAVDSTAPVQDMSPTVR
jgi:hypothetical protein